MPGGIQHRRQAGRRLGERNVLADQRVEPVVGEQCHGGGGAACIVPARAPRWRDAADLRRDELQPAGVKGAAERSRHRALAIPAQLDNAGLVARRRDGGGEAGGRGAGMEDEIGPRRRVRRQGETEAECLRQFGA